MIQADFEVDGGGQSHDLLILDDGGSTLAQTLTMTSSAVSGFDGALSGLGGTVNFDGLGFVRLYLGTRRDTTRCEAPSRPTPKSPYRSEQRTIP